MAREPLKVLTESMFYVLLSLLRQERCGTEIVRYVDDATAGRVPLGPGTLYTILAKFQEEGLIREAAVEDWRASKCSISCRSSSRRAGDGSSSSLLW